MSTRTTLGSGLLAACLLAACGLAGPPDPGADPTGGGTPAPSRTAATTTGEPTAAPPTVPAGWAPSDTEVHTAAKSAAARVAHTLTNYPVGTTPAELAGGVTSARRDRRALARALRPLLDRERWSRGAVVYPQMGGLAPLCGTPTTASVMVVVRQRLGRRDRVERTVTRTLDVRLGRTDGQWRFTGLASAGGSAHPRPPDLPPPARTVLDDPRISLPDSARWDIHRGAIAPTLLTVMAALAERTPYAVTVLRAGHPVHVFGRGETSHHTSGRAVDIHTVDGRPVVESRGRDATRRPTCATPATNQDPVRRQVAWLLQQPQVREVGSPWDLDPPNRRSFDDPVHHDHLHVASETEGHVATESGGS